VGSPRRADDDTFHLAVSIKDESDFFHWYPVAEGLNTNWTLPIELARPEFRRRYEIPTEHFWRFAKLE